MSMIANSLDTQKIKYLSSIVKRSSKKQYGSYATHASGRKYGEIVYDF